MRATARGCGAIADGRAPLDPENLIRPRLVHDPRSSGAGIPLDTANQLWQRSSDRSGIGNRSSLGTHDEVPTGGKIVLFQAKGFPDQPFPPVPDHGVADPPTDAEAQPGGTGWLGRSGIHDQDSISGKQPCVPDRFELGPLLQTPSGRKAVRSTGSGTCSLGSHHFRSFRSWSSSSTARASEIPATDSGDIPWGT